MKALRYISSVLFFIGVAIIISLVVGGSDNMGLLAIFYVGLFISIVGLLGLIIPVIVKPPKAGGMTSKIEGVFAIFVAVVVLSFTLFHIGSLRWVTIVLLLAFALYKFIQK